MEKFLKVLVAILFIALTATAQTWEIGSPNPEDVIAVLDENGTLTISGTGDMRIGWNGQLWHSVRGNITNVIIEDGVTNIGDLAFDGCQNLTSVTIPNSVTTIRNEAFRGCQNLTSVTIPNSVTTIEGWAFFNTGLTSITIPNSVMTIRDGAFSGIDGLTEINVSTDNPNFISDNDILFDRDKTILIQYPAGKRNVAYVIPNSVTTIGAGAFYGAIGLTSVTIPNSVTTIGPWAFTGTYLTEIISLAIIPPTLINPWWDWNGSENAFTSVHKGIPVYVPHNSVNAYRAANGWRDFFNIRGITQEVQVIWGRREFEFNLMPQYPDFRLEPADIINTNHLIMVNGYNVVAGRYRPELQIRDEFRHLYQGARLIGASVEYEIIRRPLNVVMRDRNGNRRDTITTEENIRTSGDLFDYIESILDFSNFATDTINSRTDDESVLRGKPRIGIQNDDSQRSLRNNDIILDRNINLSIGERFLVTVMTDSISADNYRVLERNIAITIGENFITLSTDPRDNITPIANVRRMDNRYGIKFSVNPVSDKVEISVILPNNEKSVETKIVIYDMTGNVVYSGASTGSATGGAIVWDLRNSTGRFVANGTYLVIAEVKDRNGRTHTYSARLGVKR